MAEIQFSRGVKEEVVPEVRVTRAKDGSDGRAIFYFEYPQAITDDSIEITGMYLIDEEGEIVTREVNGKFINGEPAGIEAILTMKTAEAFERFVRFMERYGEENGLGLSKS